MATTSEPPFTFAYDYVVNRIKNALGIAHNLEMEYITNISTHEPQTYFTPNAIKILYKIFNGVTQHNYEHVKKVAQRYDNVIDPHVWKWIAIWMHILSVSQNLEILTGDPIAPFEYMIYYQKAANLGDIESAYALAYNLYYSDEFDYSIELFESLHVLLTPGVLLQHLPTAYLKAQIHINEEEYDKVFPLFEIFKGRKYVQGIMLCVRDVFVKHYKFLDEIKMRTRDTKLRLCLSCPTPEITAFLATKETGISGDCTICFEHMPLIYHDCRQITHAVCVMCYCKAAKKCPTCQFNFGAVKAILIRAANGQA